MNSKLYLQRDEIDRIFKSHIRCNENTMSIKTLFGERMSRKVDYQPYYQRNYVWDNDKATFFIESILLGTDVPPLVLFNSGDSIEVIDGRQRYETIRNFKNDELRLSVNGLSKLQLLQGCTYSKINEDIQELFKDAKIRFFEFEVINEPKLEPELEDKIKKEIFRRYNSGITPLNTAEIDTAKYFEDPITLKLDEYLSNNHKFSNQVATHFLGKMTKPDDHSKLLQFFRKYMVLSTYPIVSYASGGGRSEKFDLLYQVKVDNSDLHDEECTTLLNNIDTTIKLIEKLDVPYYKSLNEVLLWVVYILSEESYDVTKLLDREFIRNFREFILDNNSIFSAEKSIHYKEIISRFSKVKEYFEKITSIDLSLYMRDEQFKKQIKTLRQSEKEAKIKLEELSHLRVQKPGASIQPVEELIDDLKSKRYLIRPSYQRQEKINQKKASAIIESIILGIKLPPIFIYSRSGQFKEIIDGQQRLLTVLAFTGNHYLDDNGAKCFPKISDFKLKGLKILKDYNGLSFSQLDPVIQDKILGFNISIIEISSELNENFEPVDLFIRLNNKPYPIKENSFEMWNSFMDKDVMSEVKKVTRKNIEWFFIKNLDSYYGSDRMLNEELVMILSFVHHRLKTSGHNEIGFFLRENKVTCRITDKKAITSLMERVSTNIKVKNEFMQSISQIEKYIDSIGKMIPSNKKHMLTNLLREGVAKRLLSDFYLLFLTLFKLDDQDLANVTYSQLKSIMNDYLNEIKTPADLQEGESYQHYFESMIETKSNIFR